MNSEADNTQALKQRVSQLLKEEFDGKAVNHFVRPEGNPKLFDLLMQEVLADLTAEEHVDTPPGMPEDGAAKPK